MSAQLTPREALAIGPGWGPAGVTVEALSGGLTNRTFRVRRQRVQFVLRIDAPQTASFNLDRDRELKILRRAEAAGIGPAVVYADPARGILITRYLEGPTWSADNLRETRNIEALATLLRKTHALPLCGESFDAAQHARHYLSRLSSNEPLYPVLEQVAAALSGVAASGPVCCCHNDVVAENILGHPPRLLDWEYACDNDAAFDLATLIENHRLSSAIERRLIAAYADGESAALAERVAHHRHIYARLMLLWFAARGAATSSAADAEQVRVLLARIR